MKIISSIVSLIALLSLVGCASAKKPVSAKGGYDWSKNYNGKTPFEITKILGEPAYRYYSSNNKTSTFSLVYVKSEDTVEKWKVIAGPAGYKCFKLTFNHFWQYKFRNGPGSLNYYESSCDKYTREARRGGIYQLQDLAEENPKI